MNLQYISDSKGQTTGVFIPINEWNDLKRKYKDIEREDVDIPEWHKDLIRQRVDEYRQNPGSALEFDAAIDEIEKEL
ncbi:MAG: addiction module protein [Bacteroidales bacterium]|nr:addiction module protein [Bacteroidales bacterium]HNW73749.1 addiction module protein [Bacteroidales bacterium]